MAPQFKGVFPRFPKWAVYEMILGFPFHTGHGLFHSIELQSRGILFFLLADDQHVESGGFQLFSDKPKF